MSRDGGEAEFRAHIADVGGIVAIQTGKLDAVIAHFLDFGQRAAQVSLGVFTDRVNLNRNR